MERKRKERNRLFSCLLSVFRCGYPPSPAKPGFMVDWVRVPGSSSSRLANCNPLILLHASDLPGGYSPVNQAQAFSFCLVFRPTEQSEYGGAHRLNAVQNETGKKQKAFTTDSNSLQLSLKQHLNASFSPIRRSSQTEVDIVDRNVWQTLLEGSEAGIGRQTFAA